MTDISNATRRELIDALTKLWQHHEGQVMYQADKLARQAVNVVLGELAKRT